MLESGQRDGHVGRWPVFLPAELVSAWPISWSSPAAVDRGLDGRRAGDADAARRPNAPAGGGARRRRSVTTGEPGRGGRAGRPGT